MSRGSVFCRCRHERLAAWVVAAESGRQPARVVGRDLGGRQQVAAGSRSPAPCVVAAGSRSPATCVVPAGAGGSAFGFGYVGVVDELLREGADPASRLIGRTQGLTTGASLSEVAITTLLNFVFTDGPYNGSTLAMFGRAWPGPSSGAGGDRGPDPWLKQGRALTAAL
ncbi:hypothetical protein VPH35_059704 [Triticum aestivum]|uniref:Dirigent protein n=1 Tax=Aegilops tauschii subsp. strangulata TaxID=200361 RepID=A0A453EUZ6_AEGTS|nr:dirigent protein 2-like [Aegilops tauschii subsp. strangulata]